MRAIWPIDAERQKWSVATFLPLLEEIGEERFAKGVDRLIAERPATDEGGFRLGFPIPSELRQYIPADPRVLNKKAREAAEWRELHRRRAENPDEFIGEADCIVMMRIVAEKLAKKQPIVSDEIWDEVIDIRHRIQDKAAASRKPCASAGNDGKRNFDSQPRTIDRRHSND
jgi:hypothetical protein